MDPFVFDQQFAKFVGQVDSAALAKGTELYESGGARVDVLGSSLIRGSVTERREGAFQVRLAANEEGGLSGSCSCPEFFNCAHAYALARAARERLVGRGQASGKIEIRAKSQEPAVEVELGRIWKLAKGSGNLLYPKDLYGLVSDRKQLGISGREPIRELKRALQREQPRTLDEFAGVLHRYFEHKGIEPTKDYDWPTNPQAPAASFMAATEDRNWDRPALKLQARVELERSPDRDWFQARAVWAIEGCGFSGEEIESLRQAEGALVKLEGKGWYRLDGTLRQEEQGALSALGLDAERGNSQRIHLCQIEDLLPESMLQGMDWNELRVRAKSLAARGNPAAPTVLKGVLRPYQSDGFHFLCRLSQLELGGVLADDMGLGKTLQTLAWMLWLSERKKGDFRALVVCPKSVTDNWVQEPKKFGTGLKSLLFHASQGGIGNANIVVANYAQLRINAETFLAEEWDAVVLDEAQYIKSPSSQTSKVAYRLRARERLALTGTPIENSLTDLWSIMRFAMPRLLGPLPTFRVNYSSARGDEALVDLRRRMRPFLLRRLKREVARDLPDRIEKDIYCELEGWQRERYEEELADARALLKSSSGQGGSFNVLQALLRLRQVCCDTKLLGDAGCEKEEPSAKVQALLDLVEPLVAEGHKVLVFSQFVRMLEIVEKQFEASGISYLSLTGKSKNRAGLVERFQSEQGESVFLLSLKAAGSGLTLTAASYVVLLDPWWNPAVEAQAIDRAHRIGQKDQVIAYRILAKDTVEEKIRKIQQEKAELAAALFGEGEGIDSKLSMEELETLLGSSAQ
ncbi:DEAD/DEAH box helicase [Pelagicoccus sp. NFK12]|uniref:DEAD/DEAH box helicase n=1 Tax=Pelagicoccus enzymogenes TaxID=2773457 RepID=A0A927II98_9BACT|nr:DEAD/DEAH box helicase [Pelagicoccus enzymogenes]MBD5780538.1 DEAD/DEAH box helicase [Pelagicoccus enzymogenes]